MSNYALAAAADWYNKIYLAQMKEKKRKSSLSELQNRNVPPKKGCIDWAEVDKSIIEARRMITSDLRQLPNGKVTLGEKCKFWTKSEMKHDKTYQLRRKKKLLYWAAFKAAIDKLNKEIQTSKNE